MTTIGDRLKAIRKLKRLSQSDLAAKIGMTFSAVSAIEKGQTSNPDTLLLLAKSMKIDENWLLKGEGVTPEGLILPQASTELHINPWRDEAFKRLEQENDRLWKLIEKLSGANFPKSPKIARALKLGVLLGDHLGKAA